MTQDWEIWPDYAYVPGKTERHPEAAFDSISMTAHAGLPLDQLAQSRAFQLGLKYLEAGFYWEAHELFEPVWMALPDPSIERQFVQGLIQLANGFLKLKMDRPKAARRLYAITRELIPSDTSPVIMGVGVSKVENLLETLDEMLRNAL